MTENEARQVLLLQAREAAGSDASWTAEDRAWATRQALAAVGESAAPGRFVAARAAIALQRLLARDAAARRWLERRAWHPAWVVLALLLGFFGGLVVDQLGPPQRVNLLAPPVWAVVGWNLLVYAALLLPLPSLHLPQALARWGTRASGPAALWTEQAMPLSLARATLLLHSAAAALALGLIVGLYLRGLVLDYRAGWQSTFLDAAAVQSLLGWLLAPASFVTGIALPDVTPLRVLPEQAATASAAPWIHLYATTMALFVVLPRLLLAAAAAGRSRTLARDFPLPLDTPYFAALHPLMRPGQRRDLRLLWAAPPGVAVTLLGHTVADLTAPLTLLRSEVGDELQLHPAPAWLDAPAAPPARRWFAPRDPAVVALERLRSETDAVLFVTQPGAPRPAWLATLSRPVLVLLDGPGAEPSELRLQALADGWLPDGRWLRALRSALGADPRLERLSAEWTAQQQARLDAAVAELAASLGRIAAAREALADDGLLHRRSEGEAAQQALARALDAELAASAERLAAQLGRESAGAVLAAAALPAALRGRVGEGRAALVGGVVTGALTGLKADLLSGGMTMGAGLVAGGLLGALGAAGMARGLNVVRGTDRSFAAWSAETLAPLAQVLLGRWLLLARDISAEAAQQAAAAALAPRQAVLSALWAGRSRRFDNAGEAEALAATLRPLLADAARDALARV